MDKIRTHPEADLELEESIRYLSEQTLWQASRFINVVSSALLKIRRHPECAHFVWNQYRRFNLSPFSYALIYRHEGDSVFIIAVAHTKRHPDYWKTRIQED